MSSDGRSSVWMIIYPMAVTVSNLLEQFLWLNFSSFFSLPPPKNQNYQCFSFFFFLIGWSSQKVFPWNTGQSSNNVFNVLLVGMLRFQLLLTETKAQPQKMGKENKMIAVNAWSNICPEGVWHWNCVCQFGSFYWSSGNESWKADWHFVSWPLPVSYIEIISWLFWDWGKH